MLAVPSEVRREESGCHAGMAQEKSALLQHNLLSVALSVSLLLVVTRVLELVSFLLPSLLLSLLTSYTVLAKSFHPPRNSHNPSQFEDPFPTSSFAEPNFLSAFHLFSYIV